ncbi:MAG TPA: hypothetical protein ENH29_03450 [Bacteroidetes bacterium]|nr:hypothetical protein [Bacteroidota bacterium]
MKEDRLKVIILLGRPAAGKSEVIDYLKKVPETERFKRFHIGKFEEIDDFPMLWAWFEEDEILAKVLEKPRMHTDKDGYFLSGYQWHLLIERIGLDYAKKLRDNPDYHRDVTCLVEFSRGSEHGGYREAFQHLSGEILKNAGIVYINVSYEESKRKNRRRFNPEKPDSILEHGLPDEKLDRLYKEIDWEEVSSVHPGYIEIKGYRVPYVIFQNEPEITDKPAKLGRHLEEVLQKLKKLRDKYSE